jgi:cytochrome b subunit of formate dehydrogenase
MKSISHVRSPVHHLNIHETCLECHKDALPEPVTDYSNSIHAQILPKEGRRAAVCFDCHGNHHIQGPKQKDSTVSRLALPGTCGTCHEEEITDYKKSRHWKSAKKGVDKTPVCNDCHGEHDTFSPDNRMSATWKGNVTATCGECHGSEKLNERFDLLPQTVDTYFTSYHGIYSKLGDINVANCASCHGNHAILPPEDPQSLVNPQNLGKTCGECHPAASTRFISGKVHVDPSESNIIVSTVKNVYIIFILTVVAGMFFHNIIDFIYRIKKGNPYKTDNYFEKRFSLNDKAQHVVLTISFILLAYSGFVLSFPDSSLALPFQGFGIGPEARSIMHRGAAFLFVALLVYHLIYILADKRGREHLQLLKPKKKDLTDFKNTVKTYFSKDRPGLLLPHYSYVEKAEYWALIWGAVIMTVSGAVLLLVDLILGTVPLWVIDLARTVHFYEAVLAVSALAVWHGYWVLCRARRE